MCFSLFSFFFFFLYLFSSILYLFNFRVTLFDLARHSRGRQTCHLFPRWSVTTRFNLTPRASIIRRYDDTLCRVSSAARVVPRVLLTNWFARAIILLYHESLCSVNDRVYRYSLSEPSICIEYTRAFFFTLDERQSFYLIKGPANVEARRGNFFDFLRAYERFRFVHDSCARYRCSWKEECRRLTYNFYARTHADSRNILLLASRNSFLWCVYMCYERNFASNRRRPRR